MSGPNDSQVVIRPARREDAALLLELIRELAEYEKLSADVIATAEQLRATLFGEKPYAFGLLAFSGESAAGFAVYYFAYSTFMAKPTLYLEDIFVRAPLRGKGIGRKLFAELIQIAAREQCGRIEWTVLDWNAPALAFYKHIGAQGRPQWLRYGISASGFPEALALTSA